MKDRLSFSMQAYSFAFRRIEALKPAIQASGISTLSRSPLLVLHLFFVILLQPLRSTLFPYTTLFRSILSIPKGQWEAAHSTGLGFIGTLAYVVLRSEEHTSELQSRGHLVCRLLLEKKKIPTSWLSYADG